MQHALRNRRTLASAGRSSLLALTAVVMFVAPARGQDKTWPREMNTDKGVLTIYQPQPEKFENNVLTARAAASLTAKGGKPVFGVFWFTARVDTDRDEGTAMLRDFVVTKARWLESTTEKENEFTYFLTGLMPKTGIPISLERLQQSLATAEVEKKSIEGLKHDPPKIIVVNEVAELLLFDGEPRGIDVPNTELEHIANSTFLVLKDKKSGDY